MPTWVSINAEPGLRDFWAIYDANFDVVLGELLRVAPERQESLIAGTRDRLRRAVAGDWDGYEKYMRAEAASYARRGLSFETWHGLVGAVFVKLTPLIVRAYVADPERLVAALAAMNHFGRSALSVLGESYMQEREAMGRETEAAAARARERAEARFGRLVESGILGVIVGRLSDRRILAVNDAALAMLGYGREEILSGAVPWAKLTPPEHAEADAQATAALRATGVGPLREKEYLHRDGHRVPVLVGSAAFEGADDEVISFILDLTERKRAEATAAHLAAVHAGEQLYRTLVDSVSDYAIFMLDAHGMVTTWNQGAQRLKGYEAEDVVGKHFSLFYAPEDLARGVPAAELSRAGESGRWESEGWRVRKDGSRFWADVAINAIKDSTGNVLGYAKVTRDLTSRRLAAKLLSDANAELEAFSYSVAHDLRAPLRGMSGFAQVLLETYGEKLDAEGKDWLQEILLNAKKMGALIDALLSLGRVTRVELRREPVDLSALASTIVARLAEAEPSRHVDVAITAGLSADMDPTLARALLENLLENAWKFTGKTAHAHIEVGAREVPEGRCFYVRDDGAGFDMAFADKLFAPFRRLHTTTEFPGTGIGLATAQRIVHRHGGRIWAEGSVGGGATFQFTLPPAAIGEPS